MLSAELGMPCSDKTEDVSWLNPCRKQCAIAIVALQTSHGLPSASPSPLCLLLGTLVVKYPVVWEE